MKSSNMMIILGLIITIGILTAYNFSLKASYQQGTYKNPFKGMEFNAMAKLDELDVEASNKIGMRIESGSAEGLWIREEVKALLNVKREGNKLTVDLTDEAKQNGFRISANDVILITNSLKVFSANTYFTPEQVKNRTFYIGLAQEIKGLQVAQLDVRLGGYAAVSIDKTKLGTLKAKIGDGQSDGPARLSLENGNEIQEAELDVLGNSELNLKDPKIVKTNYHLAEKATVTLNGRALQQFRNQ